MDAEHVGRALGRQQAESDLRRLGLAVASDHAIRAAAQRDWEALGYLLTAGSQEVEAFTRAFVAGYRAIDATLRGQGAPSLRGAARA